MHPSPMKMFFSLKSLQLHLSLGLLQRTKYMWGAHSNERKLDMDMVSELQKYLLVLQM